MATRLVLSYDVADPKEIVVGAFGDKFRKAREKKQLSFDDVANVTKIGSRMLQAIEAERFDQLPGGVFNKGFIRAYAKHLELNDEEAITAYLNCLHQAQVDAQQAADLQSTAPRPQDSRSKKTNRAIEPNKIEPNKMVQKSTPAGEPDELPGLQLPRAEHILPRRKDLNLNSSRGTPWAVPAIAAIILSVGLFYWARHPRSTQVTSAVLVRPQATQETPRTEPPFVSPINSTTTPEKNAPAKPSVNPAHFNSTLSNSPTPSVPPAPPTNAVSIASANAPGHTAVGISKPNPESSAPSLTLVIRATETSWISLEADGQPVSHETLIAPARTSVHAANEIVAKVGNAAGIAFFLNGKEIAVDGTEGEVRTYIFDAQGMRMAPAARGQVETP